MMRTKRFWALAAALFALWYVVPPLWPDTPPDAREAALERCAKILVPEQDDAGSRGWCVQLLTGGPDRVKHIFAPPDDRVEYVICRMRPAHLPVGRTRVTCRDTRDGGGYYGEKGIPAGDR